MAVERMKLSGDGSISLGEIRSGLLNRSSGSVSLYSDLRRMGDVNSISSNITMSKFYGAYPWPDYYTSYNAPTGWTGSGPWCVAADKGTYLTVNGKFFRWAAYYGNISTNDDEGEVRVYHWQDNQGSVSNTLELTLNKTKLKADTGQDLYIKENIYTSPMAFDANGTDLIVCVQLRYNFSVTGNNAGGIVWYRRSGSTWTFVDYRLEDSSTAPAYSGDVSANSCAMSPDGTRAAVGYGFDGGATYALGTITTNRITRLAVTGHSTGLSNTSDNVYYTSINNSGIVEKRRYSDGAVIGNTFNPSSSNSGYSVFKGQSANQFSYKHTYIGTTGGSGERLYTVDMSNASVLNNSYYRGGFWSSDTYTTSDTIWWDTTTCNDTFFVSAQEWQRSGTSTSAAEPTMVVGHYNSGFVNQTFFSLYQNHAPDINAGGEWVDFSAPPDPSGTGGLSGGKNCVIVGNRAIIYPDVQNQKFHLFNIDLF